MLTLWKGPPISLEFPSPSTNVILQRQLERGKNGDSLVRKCAFTSKIENHKLKSKITRKQICFLLFDAVHLCQKAWSIWFSHEVSRFQSFLLEHSLSSRNSLSIKGKEKKKRQEENLRKILPKHTRSFSIFPQNYPQAFQCNCRSVCPDRFEDSGKSWSLLNSICCFCNIDFFFASIKSIGFFGFSKSQKSSLWKGHWHSCLPQLRLYLTEYRGTCQVLTSSDILPGLYLPFPTTHPLIFLFQN